MTQYDGEIIINTEIQTDGLKYGTREIKMGFRRMASQLKGLSSEQKNSIQNMVTSFNALNRQYRASAKQIDAIKMKLDELNNAPASNKAMDKLVAKIDEAGLKYDELVQKQEALRKELVPPEIEAISTPEYIQYILNQSEAYQKLQKEINETAESMDRLIDRYQEEKTNYRAGIEREKATAARQLQEANEDLANITLQLDSAVRRANAAMSSYKKTLAQTASTSKKTSIANKALSSIFGGVSKALKGLHKNSNKAGMSMSKMMAQSLMFAVVFRVYGAIMENMGAAMQSLALQSGSTNAALSALQSSLSYLSASFVAAFSPILEYVAPALSTLIDLIAQTIAWIGQLLAALTGKGTYVKAIKVQKDYAAGLKETGKAAKGAAKDAKLATLQFDELNQLQTDKDSGSGGGGGGGGGAAGSGFEFVTEDISNEVSNLAKDMYALGEYIGKALTDAMNRIDWESIYESARNFGTGLAQFLNGLISPELFGALGRTIAGALNTALEFLNSFGTTFDWTDFGLSIATGINEFFKTFNFELLANTINVWAKGILDTLITALDNIEWYTIGTQIGKFLEELDFTEVGKKIVIAIWKAINAFMEVYKGAFDAAPLETAIISGIGLLKFKGIRNLVVSKLEAAIGGKLALSIPEILLNFGTYALSLGGGVGFAAIGDQILWMIEEEIREHGGEKILNAIGEGVTVAVFGGAGFMLGGPIGAAIGALVGLAIDAFTMPDGVAATFLKKIADALFNWSDTQVLLDQAKAFFDQAFAADNFLEFGANIVLGIATGLLSGLNFLLEPVYDLFNWVVEKICEVFGIASPAKSMEPYGEYILEGIAQGFTGAFDVMMTALDALKNNIVTWWGETQTYLTNKWDELKTYASTKFTEIQTLVSKCWSDVKTKTSEIWGTIKSTVSQTWDNIKTNASTAFENIRSTISQKWDETKSKTDEIWGLVKTALETSWDTVKSSAETKFDLIKTTISSAWTEVETTTGTIWDSIVKKVGDAVDSVITFAEKLASKVKKAFESAKSAISSWADRGDDDSGPGVYSLEYEAPRFRTVSLPHLASGTVIPPRAGEFAAVLGDNNRESEVVSPLSTMKQALTEALIEAGVSGNQNITIRFDGSLAQLARLLKPAIDSENNRVGVRLVTGGAR